MTMNTRLCRRVAAILVVCCFSTTQGRFPARGFRARLVASTDSIADSSSAEIPSQPRKNRIAGAWPGWKNIPGRIGRAPKELAVHVASGRAGVATASQVACLTGIASFWAAQQLIQRSEGAQRACFFWQKAGPIVVHYKWAQYWLKATKAPIEHRNMVYGSLHERYCNPSLELILDLKGLYVKIGQVMSSRSDFLPVQYIRLFSTLQDSIPQWPVEQAKAVLRASLKSERGLDFEDVFESIDEEALGCASIGQVHRAVLKEPWVNADPNYNGGKVVALKIMHPDAKKRFACDFQVFKWLTRMAMPGWQPLLQELETRLMTEFDYNNEARSQIIVRNKLLESRYKNQVRVPQTYASLTCKHILVMEMLEGKKLLDSIQDKLSQIAGGDNEKTTKFLEQRQREIITGEESTEKTSIFELLNLHGISGAVRALKALALYRKVHHYIDLLIDVHGYQIFEAASFSADPHPGNILELADGRLGLIDFGQTKFLTDKERLDLCRVIVDLGNKAPASKTAKSLRQAGFRTQEDDDDTLVEYGALFFDSDHISFEKGYSTPQHYFAKLMLTNPLVDFPDAAVMVGRVSVLFRGAGSALNYQVKTSDNWLKHANKALQDAGQSS